MAAHRKSDQHRDGLYAGAYNLSKAEWSYGYVSALDHKGRTVWIVDAHGYGKRFIVRADEMLTAFLEL
jgi:hypothetical protein